MTSTSSHFRPLSPSPSVALAKEGWKPYPTYKPSGVDGSTALTANWLGDVPDGWEVKRLKYSASINDETLPETTDPTFEFEYVDIGGVSAVDGIKATEPMVFENAPSRARRKVRHGDTIVSTVRTYLRAIAPIRNPSENLIVSTGFAVVRPRKVEDTYLSYALRETSFVESVVARSTGVSYPACNASEVGCIPIPLPPLSEQRAISDFLDRETGKIDRLVAKKRELIGKLKEERAALITRAVTRGLNPDVRLKPSGVEWLGDVPEGWEVKRLKYAASINDETLPETTDPDFALEYVDIGGVSAVNGITATEQMAFENAPSRARRKVRHGDTIVSTVRTYLRAIAPIRNPPENLIVSTGFAVVRPRKVEGAYLAYTLREASFVETVVARSTGVSYPACNASEVGCIPIPLPNPAEQRAIADFLDRETGKIDRLAAKVEEAIARLQEYRAALITAAVTGKIDVSTALDTGVSTSPNAGVREAVAAGEALEYPVAESMLLKAAESADKSYAADRKRKKFPKREYLPLTRQR